jgi:nitrile hydratase subunit beta
VPDTSQRATHDLGGALPWAAHRIDRAGHPLTPFDMRVDAMIGLLRQRRLIGGAELRRAIESLTKAEYHTLSYYERWVRAIRLLMIEKRIIDAAELDRRTADILAANRA